MNRAGETPLISRYHHTESLASIAKDSADLKCASEVQPLRWTAREENNHPSSSDGHFSLHVFCGNRGDDH
ncbi:hypothetical protein CEXT_731451 [Caerostris extrusa]|uniref:Uncharacterized protein n=1 Tax=Caerostris extrusa TaxID=172846 RepID=A0AAV4SSY5_CAEEX|nr:hypothetical protein CEXT_731451 [Caerostris extrusa]